MIRGVELAQYRNNIRQWRNKKEMQVAQMMAQLQCVLRVAFVIVNNIYCIPTYLIWMWAFMLPIRDTRLYIWAEKILYKNLLLMVGYWSFSAGYKIHEVGDDIEDLYDKRTLLIANHQSTGDVPLLMASFQVKKYVCDNVMWVMDAMFKYTNFGFVSMTHGDFFITQGKDTRQSQLDTFKQHLLEVYLPRQLQWMVIFPEGGFLSKRLESSQRFASKNGFPKLDNVTLPRVGAAKLALDILTDKEYLKGQAPMEYLVDLTIGYPGAPLRPLDILAIVTGYRKPHSVYFHYRKFALKDVPFDDSDKLTTWMYERWVEKEQLLKHFYEHGQFPSSQTEDEPSITTTPDAEQRRSQETRIERPRIVQLNHAWVFFVNILWILSSLFHLALFRSAKAYFFE
ncbi:acyl-CoA:lysophosphatidylglycerol acyltransferase 1 [Galendromus occidentalis]|uniref:Acyl-CoA:lysophosphatidylglycerol acyltransferase 1 n=1 Tax=Galendromus occidentalis TaxID=34638 RepID=A0AAJ6VZA0_9ACAR|nr:acyl-CoA:lysophosphatidylglycerol acyltransferase 1 [Galendromus occidentalis]